MKDNNSIPARAWSILISPWAIMFISYFGVLGLGMILPDIRETFGMTLQQGGYLSTLSSLTQVLLTLPIAMFATKMNPKYLLFTIYLLTGLGFLLHGFATGPMMVYIGRALIAIGMGCVAGPLALVKRSWIPDSQITKINGIEQFMGTGGQVVGTVFVTTLVTLLGGWQGLMNALGIIGLAVSALWFVMYKENPENPVQLEKGSLVGPLMEAVKNKNIWLLAIGWPGTTLVWIAMTTFWPTYATESLGLTMSQAGIAIGMIPIFSAIASITSPFLANAIGYDKPLIWPWGIILALAYYGGVVLTSFPLLCLTFAIAGYGAFCFVPLALGVPFKEGKLSPAAISVGTAIVLTIANVGGMFAGIIVGNLTNSLPLKTALSWCCLSPLLWLTTFFLPELGKKEMDRRAAEAQK